MDSEQISGDEGAKVYGVPPEGDEEGGTRIEMVVGESAEGVCRTVNKRLALGHRTFLGILSRGQTTLVATILFKRGMLSEGKSDE